MSVVLDDDEARALVALLARVLVNEAREHGARPTSVTLELLRRLSSPSPTPGLEESPQWLSVGEAAQRMGCSATYVRRLAGEGRIAAEKCGPVWGIRWPATVAPPQLRTGRSGTLAA